MSVTGGAQTYRACKHEKEYFNGIVEAAVSTGERDRYNLVMWILVTVGLEPVEPGSFEMKGGCSFDWFTLKLVLKERGRGLQDFMTDTSYIF